MANRKGKRALSDDISMCRDSILVGTTHVHPRTSDGPRGSFQVVDVHANEAESSLIEIMPFRPLPNDSCESNCGSRNKRQSKIRSTVCEDVPKSKKRAVSRGEIEKLLEFQRNTNMMLPPGTTKQSRRRPSRASPPRDPKPQPTTKRGKTGNKTPKHQAGPNFIFGTTAAVIPPITTSPVSRPPKAPPKNPRKQNPRRRQTTTTPFCGGVRINARNRNISLDVPPHALPASPPARPIPPPPALQVPPLPPPPPNHNFGDDQFFEAIARFRRGVREKLISDRPLISNEVYELSNFPQMASFFGCHSTIRNDPRITYCKLTPAMGILHMEPEKERKPSFTKKPMNFFVICGELTVTMRLAEHREIREVSIGSFSALQIRSNVFYTLINRSKQELFCLIMRITDGDQSKEKK